MVATTGSQGVVVVAGDAVLIQVLRRRGTGFDGGGGGDVVCGHRVAQFGQYTGTLDVRHRFWLHGHAIKVWCLTDVGGFLIPIEGFALWGRQVLPSFITQEHIGVVCFVEFTGNCRLDGRLNFLGGWPNVGQEDVVSVLILAQRLGSKIKVHGARNGVGNDHNRGGQVVHLHIGGDAALKVAVARQHSRGSEVILIDGLGDFLGERTRVTNTGGASEACEVEAQSLQILPQVSALVVAIHNLGTRGANGLDPRLCLQAFFVGLACDQTGTNHHRRVGGVGT